MRLNDALAIGLFMGGFLGIILMVIANSWTNAEKAQEIHVRAIARGAAIYSTDAGTFTWTDEKVKFIVEGK